MAFEKRHETRVVRLQESLDDIKVQPLQIDIRDGIERKEASAVVEVADIEKRLFGHGHSHGRNGREAEVKPGIDAEVLDRPQLAAEDARTPHLDGLDTAGGDRPDHGLVGKDRAGFDAGELVGARRCCIAAAVRRA